MAHSASIHPASGEGHGHALRNVLPDSVAVSQRGAVTLVRLARPAKRNALDLETIIGLDTVFSRPPEGTRAIVLHADGGHFCAGVDLASVAQADANAPFLLSRSAHQAFERIEYGQVPVIAVLHGAVVGGGLELAAAAHVRIAEQSAFYALPEGTHGVFVGGGGAVRVPRLIGTSRMIDMMLTGRSYTAAEGVSLGFSQYAVEDGQGLAKAIEMAERIAGNAPLSNFAVVQALPRIARAEPEAGFLMESLMWTMAANAPEARARIEAFLQKRTAKGPESSDTRG